MRIALLVGGAEGTLLSNCQCPGFADLLAGELGRIGMRNNPVRARIYKGDKQHGAIVNCGQECHPSGVGNGTVSTLPPASSKHFNFKSSFGSLNMLPQDA